MYLLLKICNAILVFWGGPFLTRQLYDSTPTQMIRDEEKKVFLKKKKEKEGPAKA